MVLVCIESLGVILGLYRIYLVTTISVLLSKGALPLWRISCRFNHEINAVMLENSAGNLAQSVRKPKDQENFNKLKQGSFR